jgi:hypothetical protein
VRVHGLALSKPGLDEEPRPGLSLPLPLLIAGAIVLFALGAFLIIRALSGEAPPPPPTPLPSVISSVSQTLEPTPRVVQSSGVSLTLTADEHVWVRITQDGFTAYEGLLKPGEAQSWHGDQQVIVETGNGAALNAAVNGQSVGVLGPRNRVLIRAWESEGEVTPAPTAMRATPSPADTTATPPSSATPAP